MLIKGLASDWINPRDVSAVERFTDGECKIHLKNGNVLRYSPSAGITQERLHEFAARVNAECRIHTEEESYVR